LAASLAALNSQIVPAQSSQRRSEDWLKKLWRIVHRIFGPKGLLVLILTVTGGILAALVLGAQQLQKLTELVHRLAPNQTYPQHGLIATFTNSNDPVVLTSLGEQLSLISDSAYGGSSLVRYERLSLNGSEGDGFLRIHYQLEPSGSKTPYVGVYANFSNPVKSFDVSGFSGVRVKMRAVAAKGPVPTYYFQLCDMSVAGNGNYGWKEVKLETAPVENDNFVTVEQPFSRFDYPIWVSPEKRQPLRPGDHYKFDPRQVFRFIVKIQGVKDTESEGTLDIDELAFVP